MQTSFSYDRTPRYVQSCALDASRSTGKVRDTESGNDYFGARYYASSMGRFMSADVFSRKLLANPQDLNLYASRSTVRLSIPRSSTNRTN